MATQKPISTISYNSEEFLKEKLEEWLEAHIIQSYMYVCHKGEDGDKDHIHLRIDPNKRIDPMELTEELKEYVIGERKPRGVRPWRPSLEEDWILYAVHDEEYLKIKYGGGEKGEKLPYKWEDIQCPEYFDSEIAFIRARAKMKHTSANMTSRMMKGQADPLSLIQEGENVYTINAIMRALSMTDYGRLQEEMAEVRNEMLRLSKAIYESGFEVYEDENGVRLRMRGVDNDGGDNV